MEWDELCAKKWDFTQPEVSFRWPIKESDNKSLESFLSVNLLLTIFYFFSIDRFLNRFLIVNLSIEFVSFQWDETLTTMTDY